MTPLAGRRPRIPFTVVETDKDQTLRRRLISWTKNDNDRLVNYVPQVPLLHPVKKDLHKARAECGLKRDLKCGFYQIAVPGKARAKFRFTDPSG